ncbi:coagulation factor IX-like [Sebastes fasciatus]|uniref:coagulation factor IX-like n=1 Tax=Sebastes fasciatus TaxID=394691 RepID=UPI003D9EFC58
MDPIPSISVYTPCETFRQKIAECSRDVAGAPLRDIVKVMHTSYNENFVKVPEAMQTFKCTVKGYNYKTHVHYSRSVSACRDVSIPCENGGTCKQLLDTNEHLCECPYGYSGDRCEVAMEPKDVLEIVKNSNVPNIITITAKLKLMEDKLEAILLALNNRCPPQ